MTATKSAYRTFSREGHDLEDQLAHVPGRPYNWADQIVEAAVNGERRQAVERVWEAFVDRGWDEATITPKELHAVLVAVREETPE